MEGEGKKKKIISFFPFIARNPFLEFLYLFHSFHLPPGNRKTLCCPVLLLLLLNRNVLIGVYAKFFSALLREACCIRRQWDKGRGRIILYVKGEEKRVLREIRQSKRKKEKGKLIDARERIEFTHKGVRKEGREREVEWRRKEE